MNIQEKEILRMKYAEDGWGILALAAGLDPLNVESQARYAFHFCWDLLTPARQRQMREKINGK